MLGGGGWSHALGHAAPALGPPAPAPCSPQATFRWAGDGEHSVALAPGPGICTGLREVSEDGEQGEYTVTFGTPGTFVYTSDENNDCESGLAIVIVVESDGAGQGGGSLGLPAGVLSRMAEDEGVYRQSSSRKDWTACPSSDVHSHTHADGAPEMELYV